mmetsp:Transcript_25391/g.34933  ORF Transcript_25391/g.34933 Transcript_25391/m.34933 type:complete len:180 (+) Transcript_25391:25-564(+)
MMEESDPDDVRPPAAQSVYSGVSTVKQGILLKKGMGILIRPWNLRTIIVDTDNKFTYMDRDQLKGGFFLDGTIIKKIPPELADGRSHAFEILNIRNKTKSLLLAAGSEMEADDWISCLRVAAQNTHTPHSSEMYVSLASLDTGASKPLDLQKVKENRLLRKAHSSSYEDEDENEEGNHI